jgi:hypothetical protein
MHVAEPLIPHASAFEVEVAIEELKNYKLSITDRISAEIMQGGGE